MKEMRKKIQEHRALMKKFRPRRDAYGVTKYNEARWEFLKLLEKPGGVLEAKGKTILA